MYITSLALTPITVGKESSLFCQGPFIILHDLLLQCFDKTRNVYLYMMCVYIYMYSNINRKVFVFLSLHLSESIGYS